MAVAVLAVCLTMTWTLPNTWEIRWRDRRPLAVALGALFVVCVMAILINASSPFLYFQF
jgi:hypothetical protein